MEKERRHCNNHRWVACSVENAFFGDDKKLSRGERKRRSAKDRSKFKKTDREKFEAGIQSQIQKRGSDKERIRGKVVSTTSRGFIVDAVGKRWTCFVRGLLKKEKTQHKNIIAVGDWVLFEALPDHEGCITGVEERKTLLTRADNLSRQKAQVIATNIDQVLITISVVSPPLNPHLIDRYVIAALKGKMNCVILINKIDLIENQNCDERAKITESKLLQSCQTAYLAAGIPLLKVSTVTGEGIAELKKMMQGKSSVFSGQSGTGKTSLINAVTNLQLPVGQTARKTGKGAHTTTHASLLPLDFGGWCVDTPGVKSFGLWDLDKVEIETYYAEIQELSSKCKYPNCSHVHEAHCAVISAFEKGKIAAIRYESYLALMRTIEKKHLRR